MLNPRSLEVLNAVIEHGSFSDAAVSLWCTQSAVSQQIQALERKVGAPVVVRGTRPAQPTVVGKLLIERSVGILASLREAEQEAIRAGQSLQRFRLASFASGSAALVQAMLAAGDRPSARQLEVIVSEPQQALANLSTRTVDLALLFDYGSPVPTVRDTHLRTVHREPMMVAFSTANRAASGDMSMEQLRQCPWIAGRNPLCRAALLAACQGAGFAPHIVHETDDYDVALAMVATSECITLVPRIMADRAPQGIRTVELANLPSRRLRLAWTDANVGLEVTERLVEDLRSLLVCA